MSMKMLTPIVLVLLALALVVPPNVRADGMFVAPRFVWDRHKDINEPTQKAIIVYDGVTEDLILQVKYEGPVDEFGWLVPVPALPTVKEGSMDCFYELSQFTQRYFDRPWEHVATATRGMLNDSVGAIAAPPPVKVIETKTVGAYEIAVLSAKDSDALEHWLQDNQFYIPREKSDVINGYIEQGWYFVAVRINLSASGGFQVLSAPRQHRPASESVMLPNLSKGELNPLQITFASDRCVFPLKISSANGKPSEVQVYVLSIEPLLEAGMLEKKLPLMYSNDVERAKQSVAMREKMELDNLNMRMRIMGASSPNASLPVDLKRAYEKESAILIADPDDLLPYTKVTEKELPGCFSSLSRLDGKSWWLTKQTWTFKPEEMRDLLFQPAMPYFTAQLGTQYGYFAAASLAKFDVDAVPAFLTAFQSTNPAARIDAASVFTRHYGYPSDPRLADAAVEWLKDPVPQVRTAAIEVMTDYTDWKPAFAKPLIAMLRDPDPGVRDTAAFGLSRFSKDLGPYMEQLRQLLNDSDLDFQFSGLQLLGRLGDEIPREDLLRSFESTNAMVIGIAYSQLMRQGDMLSDDEAQELLQSPVPTARLYGLAALSQNREKRSVELALPLLKDPDEMVQLRAGQILSMLTGQQFTADQSDEWLKWWDQNKDNYTPPDNVVPPGQVVSDGRAWHDRGCMEYNMHRFDMALACFRRACELGSDVTDYSACRLWIVQQRLGHGDMATHELDSYLAKRSASNDWSVKIARCMAGRLTEAELLKAAAVPGTESTAEQQCEAYYYIGAKDLVNGDKTAAADNFKKSIATHITSFEEYNSAHADLATLSGPTAQAGVQ